MPSYIPITQFKRYPDLHISRGLKKAIQNDGLIEPLIRMPNGELHSHSIERAEAFMREVDRINKQLLTNYYGIHAATTLLIVEWDELDDDEKGEYKNE